ncbi:unnamed protein product [Closterium sp. Naga37s-1]|nr:unnamed protein product [Closterium sp. Naga37s-1]
MVDPVVEPGVEDTLQAREAVRARHEAGGYGEADLEILLLRTRALWAREHPPPRAEADRASASPRTVHNEVVKSCRLRVDAGYQAWQYIMRTYKATDDLYISQLEKKLTNIRMGEQESATEYCNRARRVLANLRMAGVDYSVASYVTHVISGLPSGYNLMRRMLTIPGTREILNEDSFSTHIIQDEFMQEFERPAELLPHANYVAPAKQGRQQGQRGQSDGGGGWKSSNAKSTGAEGADRGKSAKGGDRGGGGSRREGRRCYICDAPDHLSWWPSSSRQPAAQREAGVEDVLTKDADSSGGNALGEEASCSMVGVVEPTISLALEAGEDFKAVAAAVHANLTVVLLDSGCSHHLMGIQEAFVDMQPSGDVCHVRGFNGAIQSVEGRGTVLLQGEAGKQFLVPDVLYIPGVHANLLSAGQLKENGVKLQDDGGEMLLVSSAGNVLGRARYSGRVLCTDLHPCSTKSTTTSTEVVALRTIASATKSTPDMWHARLAHVGVDTIKSSAKHEVAAGLDIKKSTADDLPKARYVWVRPIAKKSDVLIVFEMWLKVVERQTSKTVKMLCSDRGGEFLGRAFTDLVEDKGILHNLTCPYTPQQNGMAEREMRTVVEAVRTMLLHMGVKDH